MYRYNRYITRHLLHSTLLIALSLTSIVWLTQALRFIDFIVNQGVSIGVFVELTALLIPSLMLMILPPALFCAILFVYNKLKIESELIVMQAAGISRWRLAIPALQVGAIVTLIGYGIAFYLQPVSYQHFRDMQSFLRNNYVSLMLQEGVFSNPVDKLTVFIRDRDANNVMHGILVHDNRQRDAAVTLMAEEGRLVQTPQGPRFLLKNGNRQQMQRGGKLSFLTFDDYTLDISLYEKAAGAHLVDPQELFVSELFTYDPTITDAENKKRVAEGHQRILWPAYALQLAMIAITFMLSGEFNRRGQWQRISVAVAVGMGLMFSSIGLRGVIALHPELTILAYLNLLLPMLVACWTISREGKRSTPRAAGVHS